MEINKIKTVLINTKDRIAKSDKKDLICQD